MNRVEIHTPNTPANCKGQSNIKYLLKAVYLHNQIQLFADKMHGR